MPPSKNPGQEEPSQCDHACDPDDAGENSPSTGVGRFGGSGRRRNDRRRPVRHPFGDVSSKRDIEGPSRGSPNRIRTASHEAVAGIVPLAVALVAVVFLVTDLLFPGVLTGAITVAVLVLAVMLWFVLPLLHRTR